MNTDLNLGQNSGKTISVDAAVLRQILAAFMGLPSKLLELQESMRTAQNAADNPVRDMIDTFDHAVASGLDLEPLTTTYAGFIPSDGCLSALLGTGQNTASDSELMPCKHAINNSIAETLSIRDNQRAFRQVINADRVFSETYPGAERTLFVVAKEGNHDALLRAVGMCRTINNALQAGPIIYHTSVQYVNYPFAEDDQYILHGHTALAVLFDSSTIGVLNMQNFVCRVLMNCSGTASRALGIPCEDLFIPVQL